MKLSLPVRSVILRGAALRCARSASQRSGSKEASLMATTWGMASSPSSTSGGYSTPPSIGWSWNRTMGMSVASAMAW